MSANKMTTMQSNAFFGEYTSQEAIAKYTRATAGFGVSYLLEHDYKAVYLKALKRLPPEILRQGVRMLEFGCGGGMNLLHLIHLLNRQGVRIEKAVGTDFSPVLIQAATAEAKGYLRPDDFRGLEFHVAKNQTLLADLSN